MIARSSVFRFKKDQSDPQAIARRLGVRAVLTGRVTHRGDALSISAERRTRATAVTSGARIMNAASQTSSPYRKRSRSAITAGLRLKLTDAESKQLGKRYTEKTEPHRLYLRSRQMFLQFTPESSRKALEYFRQAIDLDPDYALAYAASVMYTQSGPARMKSRARPCARRAMRLCKP